jgi:hypothetical protein
MSASASQAAQFYREVASSRVVWAIRDGDGFPAPVGDGDKRAMPFWSSESRAMDIIRTIAAYQEFSPVSIAWSVFCERWIPGLTKDGLRAGVNWSGARATGYDIEPSDLKRNVEALMNHDV